MSLLFGDATVAFVNFVTTAASAAQGGMTPAAMAQVADAAQFFRDAAARDALYLVCIGTFGL
jgi:ATP-binding cassette, subfamily B (MDR/TAP), member 1